MLTEEQIQRIKAIPLKDLLYFEYKITGFMTTSSGDYAEYDNKGYIRNHRYKVGDIVEHWVLKSKDFPTSMGYYPNIVRRYVNGVKKYSITDWEEDVRNSEKNHKIMIETLLKSKGISHSNYNPLDS